MIDIPPASGTVGYAACCSLLRRRSFLKTGSLCLRDNGSNTTPRLGFLPPQDEIPGYWDIRLQVTRSWRVSHEQRIALTATV